MDVFKLAFETIVVGLLTLVWLGVAAYLLFPDLEVGGIKDKLSGFVEKNSTPTGVCVLLLAYCLGSAVMPISEQLVDDEHWPLNESAIRCDVFTAEQEHLKAIRDTALPKTELNPDHCSYWATVFHPNHAEAKLSIWYRIQEHWAPWPTKDDSKGTDDDREKVLTTFQQQESAVLGQASQNAENLKQLHERIVVLRGLVFSLFVLSLIFVCAYFAKVNGGRPHRVKQAFGIVLASSLALFALLNGWDDLTKSDIFDIPVLESLLLGINIFGLFVLRNGAKTLHFQAKRYLLVSSSFLALAYGGWMWSEVIYDRQIISSFDVLQHNPAAPMEQSKPVSQATEKMTDFYVSEDAKLEQPSPRPNASFRLPSAYAMTER